MERREFLKMGTAAGLVSSAKMLEPLAQAEQAGSSAMPIPKRKLGKTGEELSIIGFAGIVIMENSPSFASNIVAEAVDRGINYFDVAPTYGNAQERLGSALEPYRLPGLQARGLDQGRFCQVAGRVFAAAPHRPRGSLPISRAVEDVRP
jgi:hypothetical protein